MNNIQPEIINGNVHWDIGPKETDELRAKTDREALQERERLLNRTREVQPLSLDEYYSDTEIEKRVARLKTNN